MAEASLIEWTDATWNPVTGCSVVSPGCTNCYAMKLAGTRLKHHASRKGLTVETKAGPVWSGQVRFNHEWIEQPLSWRRPRRIFVCAHGDLFHEDVPLDWIAWVYGVAIAAHHLRGHTFQVLTKRAARAREVLNSDTFWDLANDYAGQYVMDRVDPLDRRSDDARATCDAYSPENPPPGIWLGVSAEDQVRADARLPDLLATPAAVRFVSVEPMLGPVDLAWALSRKRLDIAAGFLKRGQFSPGLETLAPLDWVILGGENAADARPMHPAWVRDVRDDCAEAGEAFFFKQWGAWTPGENVTRQTGVVPVASWFDGRWDFDTESLASTDGTVDDEPDLYRVGKKAAGRLLDGVEHNGMPDEARP